MTRRARRTWRWIATVATLALALVSITATFGPTTANATVLYPVGTCVTARENPHFIGWARLTYRGCPSGLAQTADCKAMTAYRWTGRAWSVVVLNECNGVGAVYVYPYAAGWSWIWTQRTGWLAVQSHAVLIQAAYTGPIGL